jgi:cyclopropane-fatty-acyl-phospholipid synthase
MELATRCLAPGGTVFVHTIGGQEPRTQIDPWYHKYIFPNAVIPTLGQLTTAMHDLLVVEDVHNIGPDYDRTLMAWWANFEQAWSSLREKYGARFYRMWKFYLMTSAAQFRARALNLFQIVATAVGTKQPPSARAA